jgi:murein DD-endopeptidase MepM/ murein hydrolase activator NlpD
MMILKVINGWAFLLSLLFITQVSCRVEPTPLITLSNIQPTETPTAISATATATTSGIHSTVPPATLPLTPTNTPTPVPAFHFCSPLAEHQISDLPGIVSSTYDPPPMGKDDRHQGVDFAYYNQGDRASILGEGVTAILPGWVVTVIPDRLPYGNMVILETPRDRLPAEIIRGLGIEPGESLYHLYAHFLEAPFPVPGAWVECGELIGQAGASGYNIPVAHLHLETRIGPAGTRFDGMGYYDTQASESDRVNYELWRMSGVFRHFDPMSLFVNFWLDLEEEG